MDNIDHSIYAASTVWLVVTVWLSEVIDYFLLQLKGLVNTSFFWNLSDLYIDFAVAFLRPLRRLRLLVSWQVAGDLQAGRGLRRARSTSWAQILRSEGGLKALNRGAQRLAPCD